MTLLSVGLGFATMIIPRVVTFYVCTALLALFGFKLLYDGWKMKPDEGQEEFEEVSEELRKKEEMVRNGGIKLRSISFKSFLHSSLFNLSLLFSLPSPPPSVSFPSLLLLSPYLFSHLLPPSLTFPPLPSFPSLLTFLQSSSPPLTFTIFHHLLPSLPHST